MWLVESGMCSDWSVQCDHYQIGLSRRISKNMCCDPQMNRKQSSNKCQTKLCLQHKKYICILTYILFICELCCICGAFFYLWILTPHNPHFLNQFDPHRQWRRRMRLFCSGTVGRQVADERQQSICCSSDHAAGHSVVLTYVIVMISPSLITVVLSKIAISLRRVLLVKM